jgi:hypothetical protein
MKSRTNKASLQGMAPGRALLLVFAVSLATSGFVLSANAIERKTAIITFDVPTQAAPRTTIAWFFDRILY